MKVENDQIILFNKQLHSFDTFYGPELPVEIKDGSK
jgi:hypothetical protein